MKAQLTASSSQQVRSRGLVSRWARRKPNTRRKGRCAVHAPPLPTSLLGDALKGVALAHCVRPDGQRCGCGGPLHSARPARPGCHLRPTAWGSPKDAGEWLGCLLEEAAPWQLCIPILHHPIYYTPQTQVMPLAPHTWTSAKLDLQVSHGSTRCKILSPQPGLQWGDTLPAQICPGRSPCRTPGPGQPSC